MSHIQIVVESSKLIEQGESLTTTMWDISKLKPYDIIKTNSKNAPILDLCLVSLVVFGYVKVPDPNFPKPRRLTAV